jgi:hypothetical protein
MHGRIAVSSSAERRIWREGRHAARRELALKLRQEGKTLAAIGVVLGVSTSRAFQMVRKAERMKTSPASPINLLGSSIEPNKCKMPEVLPLSKP